MKQSNTKRARRLLWVAGIVDAWMLCVLCSAAGMGGSASGSWVLIPLLLLALVFTVIVAVYAANHNLFFEMGVQRTWSRVCRNLGGGFEAEVFSLGNSIREGIASRGQYYVGNQYKKIYPKLLTVQGTNSAWTGTIKPNPGQSLENFSDNVEAFALAYHVPFVTFQIAPKGHITIRAGKMPVPAQFNYPEQQVWRSTQN